MVVRHAYEIRGQLATTRVTQAAQACRFEENRSLAHFDILYFCIDNNPKSRAGLEVLHEAGFSLLLLAYGIPRLEEVGLMVEMHHKKIVHIVMNVNLLWRFFERAILLTFLLAFSDVVYRKTL